MPITLVARQETTIFCYTHHILGIHNFFFSLIFIFVINSNTLNLLISLGLEIELCGSWLWVHGNSYPHREILKENGFMWAPVKKLWYFRPADYKSKGRGKMTIDQIREKHGSQKVSFGKKEQLSHCA